MDPPELASEPPRSRIGAASNSAPELRVLGWVMLGAIMLLRFDKAKVLNVFVKVHTGQLETRYSKNAF